MSSEPIDVIKAAMRSQGWTDFNADLLATAVVTALRDAGYGFSRQITEVEERENAELWP